MLKSQAQTEEDPCPAPESHLLDSLASREKRQGGKWLFRLVLSFLSFHAHAAPTTIVEEREFRLKRGGMLLISNPKGSVDVRGWALDRIRVKLVKSVPGNTPEEAALLASRMGVDLQETSEGIHLVARTGVGLPLEEKLKNRTLDDSSMDLEIRAPAHFLLQIAGTKKDTRVTSWANSAEVRTRGGNVSFQDSKIKDLSVLCSNCQANLEHVKGNSIRVVNGEGGIHVSSSQAEKSFLQTSSGGISVKNSELGRTTLVTQSGNIDLQDSALVFDFQVKDGSMKGTRLRGAASGSSIAGDVRLSFLEWKPSSEALIESESGDLDLTFALSFSAEVELSSFEKTVTSDFEIRSNPEKPIYGPMPAKDRNWRGVIHEGGEFLQVRTRSGAIRIRRGT